MCIYLYRTYRIEVPNGGGVSIGGGTPRDRNIVTGSHDGGEGSSKREEGCKETHGSCEVRFGGRSCRAEGCFLIFNFGMVLCVGVWEGAWACLRGGKRGGAKLPCACAQPIEVGRCGLHRVVWKQASRRVQGKGPSQEHVCMRVCVWAKGHEQSRWQRHKTLERGRRQRARHGLPLCGGGAAVRTKAPLPPGGPGRRMLAEAFCGGPRLPL